MLLRPREAVAADAELLTRLSFASKRYWAYPEEYYHVWRDELTITADYIDQNTVFVWECAGGPVGYYSLVFLVHDLDVGGIALPRGEWLEHMFILPVHIGRGIGRAMMEHVRGYCTGQGIRGLRALADPYARGFYEKMGFVFIRDYPSTIVGRTTPLMEISFW